MKQLIFYSILLSIFVCGTAFWQDEMQDLLATETEDTPLLVESTFKGTRLINGHNVETRKKGIMDFIIAHRFGKLNSGAYELYGLDQSNVRIGFDFGITDAYNVVVGRNSFEKTLDGYAKYRLLRQHTAGGMPISVTAFSSIAIKTQKDQTFGEQIKFADKLVYAYQLLIARKFGPGLSLQLMPSVVHYNTLYPDQLNNHDLYALGAGGRIKITKRMSINAEYYYRFNKLTENSFDAVAIGLDIETGGHVFQLQFTNSRSMVEKGFLTEIMNNFYKGDIHFGFNISRTFHIRKARRQ